MPAALNRAQHHPESMWPRRHCSSSATRGTSQRCRSNDGIAVEQSQHSVPPTECWDYSAERCRGALERGGVPKRRRRPSARNEPFVTLLPGVEMQPAMTAVAIQLYRFARLLPPTLQEYSTTPLVFLACCYQRPNVSKNALVRSHRDGRSGLTDTSVTSTSMSQSPLSNRGSRCASNTRGISR